MYVIGTAGHVDHGKSTLIEALTGIQPDRLAEEKEREMTIDLGFAWFNLEVEAGEAEEVGVVDVPGHRDFIENMLAGIGGIDLALLVIAADEGIMPQTREHLAVLNLLKIPTGIVALTKVDLVENDPDWLELVTLDISETLEGTVLEHAPMIPLSAVKGQGLEALKHAIGQQLSAIPAREETELPRLPIDRVFSLPGFGVIVTGTLIGGALREGDIIEIQPGGLTGRIRGLQTHRTRRETTRPGSRVAVNLTGVDQNDIARGQVLTVPGALRETVLVDVHYQHLDSTEIPIQHNMSVKLFTGSSEVIARARTLLQEQIMPGQEGFLQLALAEPIAVLRGDRFILRLPTPAQTLGGGQILDPHPGRRHRRFRQTTQDRLMALSSDDPKDVLRLALTRIQPADPDEVFKKAGLPQRQARLQWQELITSGEVIQLGRSAMLATRWEKYQRDLLAQLADFHQQRPLRLGLSREAARSKLNISSTLFNYLVETMTAVGALVEDESIIRSAGHTVAFSTSQRQSIDDWLSRCKAAGINTPHVNDIKVGLGEQVYFALVERGDLVPLNSEVVYPKAQYLDYKQQTIAFLREKGTANAGQIRDLFNTSRKYAIAWLEHLDELRVTRRVGNNRELMAGKN